MAGQIVPDIKFVGTPDYINVTDGRRVWWDHFVSTEKAGPGFFSKLGHFLWSPVAGPDIGLNKGIVPVVGGVALLAMLINGGDDGGPPAGSRDWTLPQFPSVNKPGPRCNVRIGF